MPGWIEDTLEFLADETNLTPDALANLAMLSAKLLELPDSPTRRFLLSAVRFNQFIATAELWETRYEITDKPLEHARP